MATLKELKVEATELGLTFAPNITEAKLAIKIVDHKAGLVTEDKKEVEEVNSDIVQMIEEVVENKSPAQKRNPNIAETAARLRTAAVVTRVVTISNNDKRDNHVTSTCYLSCENQYFAVSRIVPLDIPVEIEQCLIDQAKASEIMLHVDELINGQRTGNKTNKMVKRYMVSFEDL